MTLLPLTTATGQQLTSTAAGGKQLLDVAIYDSSGAQVDAFGGSGGAGTEYTEDAAAAADPVGAMTMAVRADTPAAVTSADGDNIAIRATNKGEVYVKHVDSVPVTGTFYQATQPVSAASLPLPTGASTEATLSSLNGKVTAVDTGAVTISSALPAGTNAIGKLAANDGVDIGDVTINNASIPVTGTFWQATQPVSGTVTANLAAGTNNIGDVDVLTINGVAPAFGSGVRSASTPRVTIATDDVVPASQSGTWTVQPGNTANTTPWLVSTRSATAGGATPSVTISAASTNATSVKGSAGTLYGIQVYNTNAAARYLKLYNKATAPTVGTDTPVKVITIPGNTAGAGSNVPIPACGIAFGTGIAFALTTGVANSDTGGVAANEIVVNVDFA